jgi:hypothetical protein
LRIAHASETNIGGTFASYSLRKYSIISCYFLNLLTDREAIRSLDAQIQTLWMNCTEACAYSSVQLLVLDRQFERARPLMEKLSTLANSSVSIFFGKSDYRMWH